MNEKATTSLICEEDGFQYFGMLIYDLFKIPDEEVVDHEEWNRKIEGHK